MRGKNNWIRSIALGLVLAMSLSASAITAMADETGGGTSASPEPAAQTYTITFDLGSGKSVQFKIPAGASYGADADDTVSVRDTFYYDGVDYDLYPDAQHTEGTASGDITFYYTPHEDKSLTYTLNCVDENGVILKTIPITLTPNTTPKIEVPEELTIDNTVYTTDEKSFSVDYNNNESLSRSVVYKVNLR